MSQTATLRAATPRSTTMQMPALRAAIPRTLRFRTLHFKRQWPAPLACAVVTALLLLAPAPAHAAGESFGMSGLTASASSTQAGAHADVTTSFNLNTNAEGAPVEQLKDVEVELPAGLLGNVRSAPRCSAYDLAAVTCAAATQVGVLEPTFFIEGSTTRGPLPIYNVTPQAGHLATIAVWVLLFSFDINIDVRRDGSYALTAKIKDLSTLIPFVATSLTLWGVPADPSHDADRVGMPSVSGETPAGVAPTPFMTNPSDCSGGPLTTKVRIDSWERPGQFVEASATQPPPTGCERLRAHPTLSVQPDSTRADSPAGYDIDLKVPQNDDPYGLGTPFMRNMSFTLPSGASLSPAAAGGLEGCTDGQLAARSCPNGARIGSASIDSPLLSESLSGSIYLGTPTPTDAYRIFVLTAGSGVTLPLVGHVHTDPETGQLTTVIDQAPQQPFSAIHLHFNGGPGAALVNPGSCGPATTTALGEFYGGVSATMSAAFTVDADGRGGACPASAPFNPTFNAGTTSALAGGFSPLTLTVSREDGQQALSTITARFPQGLLGMLARVPVCGEPQASQGDCPQASSIGTTTVAAGSGAEPLYLSGSIYLTGPYEGAPFGAAIVVPVAAGPFNLGTLVLRARILVDPNDLHLTIASDPIPQILGGIPLRVRTVNLTIDRPGFIFNPTDCVRRTIAATLGSAQGSSVTAASPFQVGGCGSLPFAPKLTASTQAKSSSRGNGAGLDVKVAFPAGRHANIGDVSVVLPKHLLARLSTIQQACPIARFRANPAGCPSGSLVGASTVSTPVLAAPLTGPIYLVSHGRLSFPDLRMVLQGQGVSLNLTGLLQLSNSGIIRSSFAAVPDVPITSFELNLPRGPHSILAAHGSLCAEGLGLPYKITGQNGARVEHAARVTVTGCPRKYVVGAHAQSKPHRDIGR